MTRWGIVATIKAQPKEVLNFVAYHLDLGADHIFVYLDNDNPIAQAHLSSHPKVTVTRTDEAYWQEIGKNRPAKHQPRQTANATHAYQMATELDWLAHIDVDEFLCAKDPIASLLAAVPPEAKCARIRPAEAMATDGIEGLDPKATYCKAWIRDSRLRRDIETRLYPEFGKYVRGGFVSHFVGKLFVRTGLGDVNLRIHRAFLNKEEISPQAELADVDLCHKHIPDWNRWQKLMAFRLNKGSYRSELKPARAPEQGGMSLHDLFNFLMAEGGEAALRRFFDEVCLATPSLLQRLEDNGLLRVFFLDLKAKREKHFPNL